MIEGLVSMRKYELNKPNVGAMHGRWGMNIIRQIRNTPPVDYEAMKEKAEQYEKAILELKKNGK